MRAIDISWVSLFYHQTPDKKDVFFDKNFNYHAGNEELQKQIIAIEAPKTIVGSWQADIDVFKEIRKKYLIYKDF